MIYGTIEPFGEEAAFYRAGIIASTIANVHRDPKKGKALTAADFMPKPVKDVQDDTESVPEGLDPKRVKADLFATFGDRIKKKGGGDGG